MFYSTGVRRNRSIIYVLGLAHKISQKNLYCQLFTHTKYGR